MAGKKKSIKCPTCGKTISVPSGISNILHEYENFPFCSERCRLVDLNQWLESNYRIETKSFEAEATF